MLVFDAHLDLAWNALDWNRDLKLPVEEIRRREKGMPDKARGGNTVSFPELRRGKVGLFIATLLARLLRPTLMPASRAPSRFPPAETVCRPQRVLVSTIWKIAVSRTAQMIGAHA